MDKLEGEIIWLGAQQSFYFPLARLGKKKRKLPTSIALEETTIKELKALAEWRGVPYQVLMRMFILDGLRNSQTAQVR